MVSRAQVRFAQRCLGLFLVAQSIPLLLANICFSAVVVSSEAYSLTAMQRIVAVSTSPGVFYALAELLVGAYLLAAGFWIPGTLLAFQRNSAL